MYVCYFVKRLLLFPNYSHIIPTSLLVVLKLRSVKCCAIVFEVTISIKKLKSALYCAFVLSSKILSYLLVFIIANLLYL